MSSSGLSQSLLESCWQPTVLIGVFQTMRRWSGRVSLCIVDQGLVSGTHFVLSLLLARWLAPVEYGVYALSLALFLLASGLHHALLLEPMGMIGPGRYASRMPEYLGTVIWMHVVITTAAALVFLTVACVLAGVGSALWPAVAALGLACPWMLLLALFRAACYLTDKPEKAVLGSCAYALLLSSGSLWLYRAGQLSPPRVFVLMTGSGCAVSLLFRSSLGVDWREAASVRVRNRLRAASKHHWNYARWSLGTTVLYWLASSIYLPLVGSLAGLRAVAALRATENLLLPMSQVLTALGLLLLPWLSAQNARRGSQRLKSVSMRIAVLAGIASLIYVVAVLALGPRLARWIYGGDFYLGYLSLLPFLGIAVVFRAIGDTGFSMALRAAGRPDLSFWCTVAPAAVTLGVGLVLVYRCGAAGAAAGWMASSASGCIAAACLFRWSLR